MEAWRAYYQANKQATMERVAAWRKANPEKDRANRQRYRAKHRDKRNVAALARYHRLMVENPEQIRALRRDWLKTPKGVQAGRLAAHRRRGAAPTAEARAYAPILLADPCSYCGGPGGELDHITPVISDGDGDASNLTAACRRCNARKNDRPLLEFLVAA